MVQELREKDDAALREQVIRMAREAGCREASHPMNPWSVTQEALERFFLLAAAAGAAAEREECAKVCDEFESEADPDAGSVLAAAIRARGEK